MKQGLLTPASVCSRTRANGRVGFAFGPRFFFLFLLGSLWIVPAFWNVRFLYGLAIWDALVLLTCIVDSLRLPRPAQLSVERHWMAPPCLSETSEIQLRIRNEGAVPVRILALDDLPLSLRPEVAAVSVVAPPGAEARGSFNIRPVARGDAATKSVYLRYQSAAQLAERWTTADLKQSFRIYPDLEQARRNNIYLTRSRRLELQKRLLRRRGMGREFESLREYQDGDEFRDICWTATSRRAKLVTKLHQTEHSQAVWIVVDSGRLLRARVGELTKLDHSVNAALSLAHLALYSGDRVGLLAYGRRPKHRIAPGRGVPHLRQILDALALIQPEISEADHLRATGALLSLQKRRSLIVWLTDLAETSMVPEVIEGAARLLRRHLVLFVVIGQPELSRLTLRRPADAVQMYETVAAQEMAQRRNLLLARLREQGALTLEIAPGQLSSALVNQYLRIKERNLL